MVRLEMDGIRDCIRHAYTCWQRRSEITGSQSRGRERLSWLEASFCKGIYIALRYLYKPGDDALTSVRLSVQLRQQRYLQRTDQIGRAHVGTPDTNATPLC